MGIFLVTLAIGAFILGGSLVWMKKIEHDPRPSEVSAGVSFAGSIIGGFLLVVGWFFFMFVGCDKIKSTVNLEKLKNERGKYIRLLNEDYNAGNLSTALDFNETQKLCNFKESGFMWSYVGTTGVCADTIPIPTGKFMPTQKIKISSDTTGQ